MRCHEMPWYSYHDLALPCPTSSLPHLALYLFATLRMISQQVRLRGDADRPEHSQMVYPRHAVQDTWGGKCVEGLVLAEADRHIYKGTKPNIDSYSAFFDNCKANDTGLSAMLESAGITHVYCCGLVFDICVKSTALHGAELGFHMCVIEDACRPLDHANDEATRATLKEAGVRVISANEACAEATAMQLEPSTTLEEYMAGVGKAKLATKVTKISEAVTQAHVLLADKEGKH